MNVLDQENDHKHATSKQDQENVRMAQKRSRPLSGSTDLKRMRVPLAGKDKNVVFPGLQRSKSSTASVLQNQPLKLNQGSNNSNQIHNYNRNQNQDQTQSNLQRLRPLSSSFKQPTLSKSNSSLGFTHRPTSVSLAAQIRNANPHKNSLFPLEDAHRTPELTPRFSTDSLKKTPTAPLPPLGNSLSDTFSENTTRLHASNVEQTFQISGDPIKRSKDQNDVIERLANDPDSVEVVAQQDMPVPRHIPLSLTPLLTLDLEFIRTGVRNRPMSPHMDLSFDSTWDEDNIEDEEENMALEGEFAQTGLVGLSSEELNNLLDF